MKSIKHTVTASNLNTGVEQQIEVMFIDENNDSMIPQEIIVINNTGAELALLYIDSDDEDTIRTNNPQFFDFIPIDSGKSNGSLPYSVQYIYVKKLGGVATANLDIYVMAAVPGN
jgi:type 1 fimbria pilin